MFHTVIFSIISPGSCGDWLYVEVCVNVTDVLYSRKFGREKFDRM